MTRLRTDVAAMASRLAALLEREGYRVRIETSARTGSVYLTVSRPGCPHAAVVRSSDHPGRRTHRHGCRIIELGRWRWGERSPLVRSPEQALAVVRARLRRPHTEARR